MCKDCITTIGCDSCYFTYQKKRGGETKYIEKIKSIDFLNETIVFGDDTAYRFNADTLASPVVASFSEFVAWIKASDCWCPGIELNMEEPDPVFNNETARVPFSICGPLTGTLADILVEAAIDTDFVLPDGQTPNGLRLVEIYAEYKGNFCKGVQLRAQGATVGTASLDGGETWAKEILYKDINSNGIAEECIDLTTVLVVPAEAGITGFAIGVACE